MEVDEELDQRGCCSSWEFEVLEQEQSSEEGGEGGLVVLDMAVLLWSISSGSIQ